MAVNLDNVQPEQYYKVKLSRVVQLGPNGETVLSPMTENIVKGKVLESLGDAIESYEPA
jgi:hypothetical protein